MLLSNPTPLKILMEPPICIAKTYTQLVCITMSVCGDSNLEFFFSGILIESSQHYATALQKSVSISKDEQKF